MKLMIMRLAAWNACTVCLANQSLMYSWVIKFRWCYVWKWALPCSVQGESSEWIGGFTKFPLWKIVEFSSYETTCILHESFSSILENYLMNLRPYLPCESPYFHKLWYIYIKPYIGPRWLLYALRDCWRCLRFSYYFSVRISKWSHLN